MTSASLTDAQMRELLTRAAEATAGAYAPYSRFRVGAALLAAGGQVYTGANVENRSYGLTICAERVAVFKAVTAGARDFIALAVTSADPVPCPPCGACRQVMAEFSPALIVVLSAPGRPAAHRLADLLPLGFHLPDEP